MFLWFVGTAVVSVWFVFRDERFDYRLLCISALIPDAVDPWWGGARSFHSVTMSVIVLAAVMLATSRQRPLRRHLLAIPIGLFMHLVFDGAFANSDVFWWPMTGWTIEAARLPSVERGPVNVVLEIAGALMIVWAWKRFGLSDVMRRRDFVRTGRLCEQPSGGAGTC